MMMLGSQVRPYALPTDDYFKYVTAIAEFDGDLIDSSQNAKTITVTGSAALSNTQYKFGTHSLYIPGHNSYVNVPYIANEFWNPMFGYSIEFYIYVTSMPADYSQLAAASGEGAVRLKNNGAIQAAYNSTSAYFTTTGIVSLNTWTHIAVCGRANSAGTLWETFIAINGVVESYTSNSNRFNISSTLLFGSSYSGGSASWVGYLDSLRTTRVICRYPVNFTPPEAKHSTMITSGVDQYGPYVCSHLHFDEADAATTFIDLRGVPMKVNNGSALIISTSDSKFGTGALYASGVATGEYLQYYRAPINNPRISSNACTIEAFIKLEAYVNNSNAPIFIDTLTSNRLVPIQFTSTTTARTYEGGTLRCTFTIPFNAWFHFAYVGNGSNCTIYINGVAQVTSASISGIDTAPFGSSVYWINSATGRWTGRIDEILMTNYVKYSGNFAVPTKAYPDF